MRSKQIPFYQKLVTLKEVALTTFEKFRNIAYFVIIGLLPQFHNFSIPRFTMKAGGLWLKNQLLLLLFDFIGSGRSDLAIAIGICHKFAITQVFILRKRPEPLLVFRLVITSPTKLRKKKINFFNQCLVLGHCSIEMNKFYSPFFLNL